MKKITFLLIIFMLTGCQGQEKKESIPNKKDTTMIEKFDFEEYKKRNSAVYTMIKNDDTKIKMTFNQKRGGVYYEYPPKPSFLTVYKEFYLNGNLKKKEIYIGENVKVGISRYYDEKGNPVKEVNEDQKFGKIKPQQVLEFLQEKGYINLKTGEGRMDEDGQPVFELVFYEEKGKKIWYISIIKGKPNTDPRNFPDIGEPSAYIPIIYEMDGETGKIIEENDQEDKKTSGIYKSYKGKNYTEEEWKEFEQNKWEDYAKKHNIPIAKNEDKGKLPPSRFLPDE